MLLLDICTHLNAVTFMCHRCNVFTFHKHVIFGDGLLDLKQSLIILRVFVPPLSVLEFWLMIQRKKKTHLNTQIL